MSTSQPGVGAANAGWHPAEHRRRTALPVPLAILILTAVYVALLLFTKPLSYGDTPVYAQDIVGYLRGGFQPQQNPLWEFGHLLWRPLGLFVWKVGHPLFTRLAGESGFMQIFTALVSINIVLGYATALAAFGIALRIGKRTGVGLLCACALLTWNAVLNYTGSGTAYVPGLAAQLGGFWLLLGGRRSLLQALLAGMLLGLSICLWFPYIFGLAGVVVLSFLWELPNANPTSDSGRKRLLWLMQAIISCFVCIGIFYGVALLATHISSLSELRSWASASSHGYAPKKNYLRLATGLPRGVFDLGNDGMTLKRYLLKDPYAPVSKLDLLRLSLWKLLLFYVGIGALLWRLFREPGGWRLLWGLAAGAGILIIFAVALFETSQSERWLPAFGVLLAAIAFVFARPAKSPQPFSLVLAIMLLGATIGNLVAYSSEDTSLSRDQVSARIDALKKKLKPNSMVAAVSFYDGVSWYRTRHPFDSISRTEHLPLYFVETVGNANSADWPHAFAREALAHQDSGGEVWVSKRLLAQQPQPDWAWIEGDDPAVHWLDFPRFFRRFAYDDDTGGPDGFVRLAGAPVNRAKIAEIAQP